MDVVHRLRQSLLEECDEDHVGLWSIVRDVRNALPKASDETVKKTVMDLVDALLATKSVKAGFPKPDGAGFKAWKLPRSRTIRRITAEWDALGRDPGIGEIVWLSAVDSTKIHSSPSSDRKQGQRAHS